MVTGLGDPTTGDNTSHMVDITIYRDVEIDDFSQKHD